MMEKVIILGAAGRDFHDFMVYWSTKPNTQVVAFTETQIPGIENRKFPPEMCRNDLNGNLYPDGVQIYPEDQLEELIEKFKVDVCTLAYSDLSYHTVQSLASRVNAAGCQFLQLPPAYTQLKSTKPLVAIVASRTGVGKSQTTRFVANYYKEKGLKIAAVRHPMPYDTDLNFQRCERFETMEDMDKYRCTIEEREEYFRHIEDGNLLFAGVDYEMILREAEKSADLVLWDGGNNDFSFYKPDLTITLVDSLRPTDELHYFPGELNVRLADAILITKTNELKSKQEAEDQAKQIREKSILKSSEVPIYFGKSTIKPVAKDPKTGDILPTEQAANMVRGQRCLVVEDGPTCTHGGMPSGAGYALAKSLGASEIVDPRPFAKGSLVQVFEKFPHLESILPAMGYGEQQVRDLEATIQAVEKESCDVVVFGTPIDPTQVVDIGIDKKYIIAQYDLELVKEHENDFFGTLDSVGVKNTR